MASSPPPRGAHVPTPRAPDVAIVGLGCVLPDAPDVATFWRNIESGRCSIRDVPPERWDPGDYYAPDRRTPDKTYSRLGSFVEGFRLDPRRFRIPPAVLRHMDVIQQWALEAADQALRDARVDERPFDRSRCAVILGNARGGEGQAQPILRLYFPLVRRIVAEAPTVAAMAPAERERFLGELEQRYKARFPDVTEDTMPGELSNIVAGRIANQFNLTGKNFTTDAACASSVAAVDAAVRALRSGECDAVLTGGVDRTQGPATYVKFAKIGALSARGSFPFDERADGFVMGEGCALFLLMRRRDAERAGYPAYAVVRGVGASSDGRGRAITAPGLDGQVASIRRALQDAGVGPETIDLVEGHGTGTLVGDAVEVQALAKAFDGAPLLRASVALGSVKSNLGHLKSAAGAAGLLKATLALHHRVLPPSIGFERPSPHLGLDRTPFHVNTLARPWPEPPAGRARRVLLNSYGFGGTNFNLVLEEAGTPAGTLPPTPEPEPASAPDEAVSTLRGLVAEATGFPATLLDESVDVVRDLGATPEDVKVILDGARRRLGAPARPPADGATTIAALADPWRPSRHA